MLGIENLPKLAGPFLKTERKGPAAMIQQFEQDHGGGMAKDLAKNRRVVMPSWTEHEEIKELQKSYSRNKVRTTKYTFLSFIPKNLFEQLHRFANLYFIFLAALNFVPIVNAFQPEISIIPIVFVMSITAVKDLWEDQRRRKSDQKVNNRLCDVYDRKQKRYVERRWAEVCVGDLVRLCCNEIIPADMVLLHSSDPNGVCHIETANLDGETNLKQRQVVRDLPQGSEFVPENYSSHIECENPNNDLRRFRGFMEHPGKVRVGLHSENLLLRSCTVRNTETVIGIVVYAGHETKAMQNNSGPRYKRSKLERRLNMDVLWCVILLLLMCLIAAVGHGFWLSGLQNPIYMIPDDTHPALAAFYMFWTMIIVLQVLIPISLYVSIEIVKLGQIYFIQNDLDLYNPVLDTGVQCRALNITEDLGQIQFLFSDKTGTLTENRMLFRRCTVAGTEYPHHENAISLEQYEDQGCGDADHSLTLRSRTSRKSLSCKSLSCNRSSVSLNTLTAESDTHSVHDTLRRHTPGAFSGTMVLEEQEYEAWLKRHEYAETSIENREELLLESAERLETNLTLLGATGIVDRLQEEVPETIEALQEAGIKVWVLTGDKQETAINIAFACKLLRPTDHILMANCDSKETCEARLHELQHEIRQVTKEGVSEDDSSDCVLVIDGRTLDYTLQKELQGSFLELTCCCRSVICCRSTPLQKSQVVRLVRDKLKVMTLAIGDGANDVSMIQMADVGIGISGQEGMQAVMSSDFAISRFKFLRKLILVHGHWCYTRLANMILYFFYKNVMYVNLLFWYQFFCGFSGSTMTNSWVLIFFNLLFTSVPPIIYGVLDKDVSGETLLDLPDLYKSGQNSQAYLPSTFWMNILDAFYQSLVCFFIPYFAYTGSDIGVFSFGSPINGSALLIILLHQLIESRTVTWIHTAILLFSALFYYAFVLLFSLTCVTCNSPTNPLGIETKMMSDPLYYLVCGLTTVLALLPRILCRTFCNTICPSDLVRAQKMERLSAQDYSTSLRQWKENKAAQRLSSRHVPQNLSVNADMPHLTDCIAEAGAVLS
ncbi:hypothetical protein cypCar_00017135 [Cyprinus carpio]|nr:hypothetical protein cypCar_00017135 [Cyprinus carpio]